jgi:hypothetical protein
MNSEMSDAQTGMLKIHREFHPAIKNKFFADENLYQKYGLRSL